MQSQRKPEELVLLFWVVFNFALFKWSGDESVLTWLYFPFDFSPS